MIIHLALGALLLQSERRISDVEVVLQIRESPYLQYFCGFSGYTDAASFSASSMVHFRKRLTSEFLLEVNELIIAAAVKACALRAERAELESLKSGKSLKSEAENFLTP